MMDLKSIGLLNKMMDFWNQPLKSLVLLNEMMDFFRTNVLISDHRTDNKHNENIFAVNTAIWVLMNQRYDPTAKV